MNNDRGFSLIELLISMVIIMFIMLGLLRGILEYEKFTARAKMKDKATEIAKQMVAYIESLPYIEDDKGTTILYPNYSNWKKVPCIGNCSFFETELQFYSVGSPTPDNPINNLSSTLRLRPQNGTSSECACSGNYCPTSNLPLCTYEGFSRKKIYVGINVASLSSVDGKEIGKAASVMVWYFEPFTNKYQQITNLVVRENK